MPCVNDKHKSGEILGLSLALHNSDLKALQKHGALTLVEPWQCAAFGKPLLLLPALLQTRSCTWSALAGARRRQHISMGELMEELWLETGRLDS